jgi:hypothetical protein
MELETISNNKEPIAETAKLRENTNPKMTKTNKAGSSMKCRTRHRTWLILDTPTETDASIHHATLQGVIYEGKNALRGNYRRKLTNNFGRGVGG